MTIKEQLISEIQETPLSLVTEILNFVRDLKARQPKTDFMDFAGMAAQIDQTMQEVVSEAEKNRQLEARSMSMPICVGGV